ncbi:MAG TPA: TIGR00282 family metallophosphoesterase [Bacilli bacterium]|nr:TIGR00282 family metallophosphoesterase [Bacilli bacterium]
MIKVLFIGDIIGRVGRESVLTFLNPLQKEHNFDLIIANGENATHGDGLNKNHYKLLIEAGINVITLGNHYDGKKELRTYIDDAPEIVRPLNLKEGYPGEGSKVFKTKDGVKVRVTNLLGQVLMNDENYTSPFTALDSLLEQDEKIIHIVDFHAEATGEKQAFAWEYDGKVATILGTHTHVQTNDDRIMPAGTGYISDVGMCGPYDSVIGVNPKGVVKQLRTRERVSFIYPKRGRQLFSAVILEINKATKLTNKITKIKIVGEEDEKSNR